MPLLSVTWKAHAALNGTQEVRNDMLRERFENALKNAVLTRDSRTTSTMRLILAA